MVQVRDRLEDGYKGRPTFAVDRLCPCRPCFNAHDCGHSNSYSGWVTKMHCATNYNRGCPQPIPEPYHIVKLKNPRVRPEKRRCVRCGETVKLGELKKFGRHCNGEIVETTLGGEE